MNCSYCSVLIGEEHESKEPFFLKIRGKNRMLCSECYDYLETLDIRKRGYIFTKYGTPSRRGKH